MFEKTKQNFCNEAPCKFLGELSNKIRGNISASKPEII
jgi:hypothetical protein